MNRAGSLSIRDNTFSRHKKPKRKRHRNKLTNSALRRNRQKKFYSQKKSNSSKLNSYQFSSDSVKIMSNWYWSNYQKALEWQDRHKLAHWKACALALMEENRCLVEIINNMRPGMVPELPVTQSNLGERTKCIRTEKENPYENFPNERTVRAGTHTDGIDEEEGDEDGVCNDYNRLGHADADTDDDEIEFEMSEEMLQFFEQSYKHKMDLKKLREKELLNNAEDEIKQMQNNKIKRSTEMNLLYGDGASMIIGMETAVQLSFDKYCDIKSPKYWPNIPFRL